MAATSVLDALRAVATHCQQAQPHLLQWLQLLPTELLSVVLSHLDTYDLACLAATCRPLWRDAPTAPPRPMPLLRPMGPVETELRRRATARGLCICSSLPKGALSWVPYLLKRVLCDALRREPSLAVGDEFSLIVDAEGRLLTCGTDYPDNRTLGHTVGPDAGPDEPRSIGPPTLVPSMQDRRIVNVAADDWHCLALSREGEVYSWGDGTNGQLGHADGGARSVPSRIESLSQIESIAAGINWKSAAVDEAGRLFTWGRESSNHAGTRPTGLGYALDSQTESQLTPKRVEALSEDRVVGVALGHGLTLAVTDAGAVFSCGYSENGALGHGSLEAEVLPRRIEALVQTGLRFVTVAAGVFHSLALTEEGELYGWGRGDANGHGWDERTPRQVAAFIGQRVKHMNVGAFSSCAVTEKGELYTWGVSENRQLGHGDEEQQLTPKRVEGLNRVKVAAAAMCYTHTLVADEDGVVWAFGNCLALGLGDPDAAPQDPVLEPTRIPALRVRARKSPDVLPFR